MLRLSYILLLGFSACQTAQKPPVVVVLPAYLHSHFDECLSAEGTLEIEGSRKSDFSFAGEVDWQVDKRHDFAFEVVNSVGQGLWKIEREGELIDVTGLYASEVPKLTVEKETQKLLMKGYFTGFLVQEFPCLFKFKLPSAWQDQIIQSDVVGKVTKLKLQDPFRDISVQIDQSKGADLSKVCINLSWRQFLGLSRQDLMWCNEKLTSRQVTHRSTLHFNKDLVVKWSLINEGK